MKKRPKRIQVGSIVRIKPEHYDYLKNELSSEATLIAYNNKTGEEKEWIAKDFWAQYIKERLDATWIVTKMFPSGCHIRCVTNTKIFCGGTIKPSHLICIISCI